MKASTASPLVCAFALAVVGCSKERSEPAPSVAVAPVKSADEPERLCGAKSLCPNEPVDEEGTMLCTSLARDATCGAKFLALVKCQIAKEKCSADGKIDQTATLDLCKAEDRALQACNQAKQAATKSSP